MRSIYFSRSNLIDITVMVGCGYFCDIYNVTQVTISKSISNLATFGYIKAEYDNTCTNNSKRIIKLSEILNLKLKSIKDNFNTGYKQNFKQYNNKLNKKEDSIYYKDEDGNEYWHGKLIPKNEATIEEQEELNERELLSMEKEMLGIYISGHPLENYRDLIEKQTNINSS